MLTEKIVHRGEKGRISKIVERPLPQLDEILMERTQEIVVVVDPEALKAEILGRLRADERVRIVLDVVKPVLRDHEQPRA
jgi:hypothetical protein